MKLFELWLLWLRENKIQSYSSEEWCLLQGHRVLTESKDTKWASGRRRGAEAAGCHLPVSLLGHGLSFPLCILSALLSFLWGTASPFYSPTRTWWSLLSIYRTFSPPTVNNLMFYVKFSRQNLFSLAHLLVQHKVRFLANKLIGYFWVKQSSLVQFRLRCVHVCMCAHAHFFFFFGGGWTGRGEFVKLSVRLALWNASITTVQL